MPDVELRSVIDRLRERKNALRGGDGFGNAGTLIGAYKRAIVKLEELAQLVETLPPEPEKVSPEKINPDCLGNGSDNVPGCQCRLILHKT